MKYLKEIIQKIDDLSEDEFNDLNRKLEAHINKEVVEWVNRGRPVPPPDRYKRRVIKAYASKFGIHNFVETGTYLGGTTYAMRNVFEKIVTIEVEKNLYKKAKMRFEPYENITVLNGDSGELLPIILPLLDDRCLFWLDGHYSAGITGKGDLDSPIIAELQCILSDKVKDHVILIDDARDFIKNSNMTGYCSIDELYKFVKKFDTDYDFTVQDDIIRITRASAR
jgi:hypothetical protein